MEEDPLQGPEDSPPGRDVIIVLTVFFELSLAPISLFIGWLLGHNPLERFKWSLIDALWGTAAAVPLVVLFMAVLTWPVGPLAKVKEFCRKEVLPLFAKSYWSELALLSLSAGVGEEMLFRGVFQASFTQWWGLACGLLLASMLFGFLHPISLPYSVIMTFIGLYIGVVWERNGNLLTVIVTHAVYDFAALGFLIRIKKWDDE
ncbi:MAG: lysostaphin resistance A-like protein [Isosphaeraceae bacterium]